VIRGVATHASLERASQHRELHEERGDVVLLRYDPFREVDRSFSLPRPVTMPLDAYRDDLGVLTLTIPIAEQDQPHKVPVTAGHAMGNGGGGGNSQG
jgi:HSP20 family molecular chaperone IbpA